MIAALIFDFDGLIVDTETPAYESWQAIYAEYGQDLPISLWQGALGTNNGFDSFAYLYELLLQHTPELAATLERSVVVGRRHELKRTLSERQPLLPGVADILRQAEDLGLPCAIASSSERAWVMGWLQRHGIADRFRCLRTREDVMITKPAPDLFLAAAECMGYAPHQCLVFEDSPSGILAARAAGMRCVAVPGAISQRLALPSADLVLPSLAALPLSDILSQVEYEKEKGERRKEI